MGPLRRQDPQGRKGERRKRSTGYDDEGRQGNLQLLWRAGHAGLCACREERVLGLAARGADSVHGPDV